MIKWSGACSGLSGGGLRDPVPVGPGSTETSNMETGLSAHRGGTVKRLRSAVMFNARKNGDEGGCSAPGYRWSPSFCSSLFGSAEERFSRREVPVALAGVFVWDAVNARGLGRAFAVVREVGVERRWAACTAPVGT
jgi:hypothetical protein